MNHRSHAEHNERACSHVSKDAELTDWVVTTAFYAAYHYVSDPLFPVEVDGTVYQNLNHYVNQKGQEERFGRHGAMLKLVRAKLPAAYGAYNWLHENCVNARYHDYVVTPQNAAKARGHMTSVKVCCPKTPPPQAAKQVAQPVAPAKS